MSFQVQCQHFARTIYLHIGLHKTGSTAIQSAFNGYDDGRRLYAPLGYENHSIPFYTAFSGQHRSYHIWLSAGLRPGEIDRKRSEFDAVIRGFLKREIKRDIIISGEDISVLPSAAVADLAQVLSGAGARIVVIAYVRSPLSFIASNLQESIKAGFDVSRPVPPEYRNRLEKFVTVFGRENVVIREFSRGALTGGDVVRDFAELVHVDDPPAPSVSNVSLSTEATRVLYLVNQFVSSFGESRAIGQARQKLVQHVQTLFPGQFSIPTALLDGLVDEDDLDWLFETSEIDFRRPEKPEGRDFDPHALHRFLNEPAPAALETLRTYLAEEIGVPSPPKSKAFIVARYFMSFLKTDVLSQIAFDADRYLNLNPDVRRAGMNAFEHFLKFGIREGRRTE